MHPQENHDALVKAGDEILNFTSNYLPVPALLGMLADARNPYRDDLAPLTQVLLDAAGYTYNELREELYELGWARTHYRLRREGGLVEYESIPETPPRNGTCEAVGRRAVSRERRRSGGNDQTQR